MEKKTKEVFPAELSLRFEKEKIFFDVERTPTYFMTKETFLGLLNFEKVADAFEGKVEEPKLELPFEFFCKIVRLTKKGLDFTTISKFLKLDERVMKNAYLEAVQKFDSTKIFEEVERQGREGDEKDSVTAYRKDLSTGQQVKVNIEINLNSLKTHMKCGTVDNLIKNLSLDENDFREFVRKNQRYLDLIK
jgi:hypothetical protein